STVTDHPGNRLLLGPVRHVPPPRAGQIPLPSRCSMTCSPHSFLPVPAQRPARSSSPSPTGRVQGQQPILGYPWSCSGLYGTSCFRMKFHTSLLVQASSGLTFTRLNLASHCTTPAAAR